jgi:hypothetical protein
VILLASSAYTFFSLALLLLASLFIGMFLWNIRRMKRGDLVAALRILAGLGVVSIILLGLVAQIEGVNDAKRHSLERSIPSPATGDGGDIAPGLNRPVPAYNQLPTIPRDNTSSWIESHESLPPNTIPPVDQWWEETSDKPSG